MSKTTNISWCDSTSNAVIGCTKVSPGCASCYAAIDTPARVLRHRGVETWGPSGVRVPVKGFEKSMLAMNKKPWICDECGHAQETIGSVAGISHCTKCDEARTFHRRRTFCDSNSDWLDEKWPVETLAHFLDVCRRCPDMILILCTKRPENWEARLREVLFSDTFASWPVNSPQRKFVTGWLAGDVVPSNIILLTSIENQAMADQRIPELLKIPAACQGLSLEPLLGPVDLNLGKINHDAMANGPQWAKEPFISWLIIGGESGPHRRSCGLGRIHSLVAQSQAAGVAAFVKQIHGADGKVETDMEKFPKSLRVRQFPNGF